MKKCFVLLFLLLAVTFASADTVTLTMVSGGPFSPIGPYTLTVSPPTPAAIPW